MTTVLFTIVWCALLVATSSRGLKHKKHNQNEDHTGVVIRSVSRLGEVEVRVKFGDLWAMESETPTYGEDGLFYRQVTDGRRFVQGIYQGRDNLVDCDITKDKDDIKSFMDAFQKAEVGVIARPAGEPHSNATMTVLHDRSKLDRSTEKLLDVGTMKTRCRELHRQLRRAQKKKVKQEERLQGQQQNGNVHKAMKMLKAETIAEPITSDAMKSGRAGRVKRGFIYPGTNWCGNGNVATAYHDLGDNVATDKCCRQHDYCPYTINGFASRYHLFNYRFHTLSHCQCDEKFRTCLRSARNSVADMVGSIYFNVVSTKCFDLSPTQSCVKRSWWGRCVVYEKDYQAELKEPINY